MDDANTETDVSRPKGFPDPARQKICLRCQKWFEPTEGIFTVPEAWGPIGSILQTAAVIAGDNRVLKFMCHRCVRIRRFTKLAIFGTFGLLVTIVLVLDWLGII